MEQGTRMGWGPRASVAAAVLALLAAGAGFAEAARITKADRCEGKKNQVAGEYADCIATAEKRLLIFGDVAEYNDKIARCEARYSQDWKGIEEQAGAGTCPSEGDEADIQGFLDGCQASVSAALAGGALGLDPATCNAALADALAANATCDAGKIVSPEQVPVCPAATCDQQCEPVDTAQCVMRGGKYVCPPPSCTCGPFHQATTCTKPAPTCDPVCEPPACGLACDANQCGDTGCPACEGKCGETKCTAKCRDWDVTSACAATFDCSLQRPECTTTCKAPHCYWYNRETSGTAPLCEATVPGNFVEAPGKTGLDCSAAPGAQDRDWAILCEKPECEIRCQSSVLATCSGQAQCDVDCSDPVCQVSCDTPVCSVDPVTGANVCTPPQNCTTSCSCRIGTCTRSK